MRTLFLAWQDPASRCWFPIGKLSADGPRFRFVYTRGARKAQKKCQFAPLQSFPDIDAEYESDELFPLFANRLPPRSRPDFPDFVRWLNLPENEDDPIALLVRSGGRRVTDQLEILPCPEPDAEGRYHLHFFAHGLRHLPPESIKRIERLQPGEPLLMVHDFQNQIDPWAIMLRTSDAFPGDRYFVGYCPRYHRDDVLTLLEQCAGNANVAVERLNPAPAPLQLRLLCSMTACWPEDFRPCSSDDYQSITAGIGAPVG